MSTRSSPVSSPVFPVLDTLRGVGAVAVLTTHVTFQSGDYVRHGALGPLLARLDVGVALFFVLSGFLLARPYVAAAGTGARPSTRAYLRKRFWRIYPLYAVTVVLALLLVRGNDPADAGVWWRALTMTDTYTSRPLPQGLTQMWSLAVEVAFYVLLPLLVRVALGPPDRSPRVPRLVAVLGGATVLSLAWNLVLADSVRTALPGSAPALWLPAHLTWFVVGFALALVQVAHARGSHRSAVELLVALGRQPGVCWATAAALLLVAATPLGGPVLLTVATPSQSVTKHVLYALAAGLVVLTGVVAEPGSRYDRTMSVGALRRVGLLSYGVFCVHLVVLDLVRRLLDHQLFTGQGAQLWLLTLVGSLAAAWLLHRLVERPGMRVGHTGRRRGGRVVDTDTSTSSNETATR